MKLAAEYFAYLYGLWLFNSFYVFNISLLVLFCGNLKEMEVCVYHLLLGGAEHGRAPLSITYCMYLAGEA